MTDRFNPFEYSFAQPVVGRARFVLMLLEATAHGLTGFTSLPEVAKRIGCEPRPLQKALKQLARQGVIDLRQEGDSSLITFDGHQLELEGYPSRIVDDPWQIIRAKVFAQKGSQCSYCGNDASQVDHILPRSRGGSNDIDNLVPCCARCNISKGDRAPDEWRQ